MELISTMEEKENMDPYKVLGVTESTSDDDIKRAYRNLAKKYHPDNYINSPLADLASNKMKEINEAYDLIMNQRTGKSTGDTQAGGGQASGSSYQGQNQGVYNQIRIAINAGNIQNAETMLQRITVRDAEWHFLMGSVYYRKGWFDEAKSEFETACRMAPSNAEYQNALHMLNMNGGYGGYRPMESSDACNCCAELMCVNLLCSCCCQGC